MSVGFICSALIIDLNWRRGRDELSVLPGLLQPNPLGDHQLIPSHIVPLGVQHKRLLHSSSSAPAIAALGLAAGLRLEVDLVLLRVRSPPGPAEYARHNPRRCRRTQKAATARVGTGQSLLLSFEALRFYFFTRNFAYKYL